MSRRRTRWISRACLVVLVIGQGSGRATTEDELDRHAAFIEARVEDRSRPRADRVRLAMELAATLERAAAAMEDPGVARTRRERGIRVLERLVAELTPGADRSSAALRAAQLRLTIARSFRDQAEIDPTDRPSAEEAERRSSDAVERLRKALPELKSEEANAARASLAQALFDAWHAERRDRDALGEASRVLAAMEHRDGNAEALRARTAAALGRREEAEAALKAAEAAGARTDVSELWEARAAVAEMGTELDSLIKRLDGAKDEADGVRRRLAIEARLKQIATDSQGRVRVEREADLFRRLESFGEFEGREGTPALLAVGRALTEPAGGLGAQAWDRLAEAKLRLGNKDAAETLWAVGATKAESLKENETAARMRYRSAASMARRGESARADALLGRVAGDVKSGEWRTKAAVLRAALRGAAWRATSGAAERDRYAEALRQVATGPEVNSRDRARIELAELERSEGNTERAIAEYAKVVWESEAALQARVGEAAALRERVERTREVAPSEETRRRVGELRAMIEAGLKAARSDAERAAWGIEKVRLETVPGVGDSARAAVLAESLMRAPLSEEDRRKVAGLRVVALMADGRSAEAERVARDLSEPGDPEVVLEMIRRLDATAGAAGSDSVRRRSGGIIRSLTKDPAGWVSRFSPRERAELLYRSARGAAFVGDAPGGLKALRASRPAPEADTRLQGLAARTWLMLEDGPVAVAAARAWAKGAEEGSAEWFEARLATAQALADERNGAEARRVVRGVAVLHPDMGGDVMKGRFDALVRRLDRGS